MTVNEQYSNELYHYGVKGMKWGVRRAQRREAINKYRKDYNDMTKNDSRLTKSVNKLTGADKVYAVSKYTANKPTKTSGVGSAFAVSRKAAAAGRVAGMESKIANRNNNSKKTGFQRDVDSIKANIGARMKTVRDAKNSNDSKTKSNSALKNYTNSELTKRGKSAIDVLLNGDTDWMGHSISDANPAKEARNRVKAALERLMYNEEQIDNKKFFGSYGF